MISRLSAILSSDRSRHRLLPILVNQAVAFACGIASVRLVSHWVPPPILGVYSVFLTFTPLGMWLIHSGLVKYVGRHWAGTQDRNQLAASVAQAWLRKLPWLALAALGAALALRTVDTTPVLLLWVAVLLASALLSLSALGQAALQARRQHWRDLLSTSTGSLTRTFVPPLSYLLLGGSTLALYGGFALHAALAAAAPLLLAGMRRAPAVRTGHLVAPVYEGPLFLVLAAAAWSLAGMNRWITTSLFGTETGGQFSLAANIAQNIPAMIGGVFVQFLQPSFYQMADENPSDPRKLLRLVDISAAVFTLATLGGLLLLKVLAPWLVGWLIDERYARALPWLLPSGCFALTTMAAYFYHLLLLAAHRERACGKADLASAGVLVFAVLAGAFCGETAYAWVLLLSPLCPWLITRSLAKAALASGPTREQVQ